MSHQIPSVVVTEPTYGAQVEALGSRGIRLIELAATAGSRPVPSCPGWDAAHLLVHLNHIYDWAARNLAAPPAERVRLGLPDATVDLRDCAASLAVLVERLRAAKPSAACAGPLTPRTAAWWARRQLLETVIHLWDIENALGIPAAIDTDVAALGTAEFVEVFAGGTPMPVRVLASEAEVLLLLWGRRHLEEVSIDGDPAAYRAWRSAIAT